MPCTTILQRLLFLSLFIAVAINIKNCPASIIHNIELGLVQGSGQGFAFSYLHSAGGTGTAAANNGNTVALGGFSNGNFINQIVGDFDTVSKIFTLNQNSVALTHGQLTLSNTNKVVANSLTLTGGKLIFNSTWAGGYIDYKATITNSNGQNSIMDTGSFYFASKRETGNANSPFGFTPNSGVWANDTINFAEWGNNWTYTGSGVNWGFLTALGKTGLDANGHDYSHAYGNRLGLDLHGTGLAIMNVPEPASMALWGGFVIFSLVSYGRRRV